jgi:hypothetical protein
MRQLIKRGAGPRMSQRLIRVTGVVGLLFLLSVIASAQVGTFHAPVSATVAASASTTLTIQQPASGAKSVTFIAAIVQCPGQSFAVQQLYNGTGATATTLTTIPMMTTSTNTTSVATAWSASNVGFGTVLMSTLTYTAGAIAVIDLTKPGATMSGNGINQNYSVTVTNTGSSSCTATLDVIWQER